MWLEGKGSLKTSANYSANSSLGLSPKKIESPLKMFSCILQSLKQHSDTLSIHNVSLFQSSQQQFISVEACSKRVFKALLI